MERTATDRPVRRRRAPLTREKVLRAALKLADEGGIEAVSMRRLGQALKVEAMSLYKHVADKDDLLDGLADLVTQEFTRAGTRRRLASGDPGQRGLPARGAPAASVGRAGAGIAAAAGPHAPALPGRDARHARHGRVHARRRGQGVHGPGQPHLRVRDAGAGMGVRSGRFARGDRGGRWPRRCPRIATPRCARWRGRRPAAEPGLQPDFTFGLVPGCAARRRAAGTARLRRRCAGCAGRPTGGGAGRSFVAWCAGCAGRPTGGGGGAFLRRLVRGVTQATDERERATGQSRPGSSIRPRCIAVVTADVRSATPSFSKILSRCVLTVASEMRRSRAISRLEAPRATSRTTSSSRTVSVSDVPRRAPPRRREAPQEPRRDRRGERRAARRRRPDRLEQRLARRVLEQVAGRARLDRPQDLDVRVVGGEHQHRRRAGQRPDAPDPLDPVDRGHLEVHQHDVRPQLRRQVGTRGRRRPPRPRPSKPGSDSNMPRSPVRTTG